MHPEIRILDDAKKKNPFRTRKYLQYKGRFTEQKRGRIKYFKNNYGKTSKYFFFTTHFDRKMQS